MRHISFISERETINNALYKEHTENFINSPGFNEAVDGDLPISRRQLTRRLYSGNTAYPTGKIIEYYLEGESALKLPVSHEGSLIQNMQLENPTFSSAMNWLYDAAELYTYYCNKKQLEELQQLKKEFSSSEYSYEAGKQLENFLTDNNN